MRKKRLDIEKIRGKIQAQNILQQLDDHRLNPDGNPMSVQQVRICELMLKKCMPDLKSVEHKGKVDSKIEVVVSVED